MSKRILMHFVLLALCSGLILELDAPPQSMSITERRAINMIVISQSWMEYQYQNVTHNGDLSISNNDTLTIADSTFYMNGTITARDASTLIIKNSKFTAAPFSENAIVLEDHANLVILNTTMIFKQVGSFTGEIHALNNSRIILDKLKTQNRAMVVAYDDATIIANRSTLVYGTTLNPYRGSGVATFGNSTARIDNSTMNGVYIWDNSTTSIRNSTLGVISSGWKGSEKTAINVTSSRIDTIEIIAGLANFYAESSEIRVITVNSGKSLFLRSSVGKLESWGKPEITFIDSSYGTITSNETSVLVGWNVPLIGLVMVPYASIPIIQGITVLLVIAVIVITASVIWHRKIKHKQKQDSITNDAAEQ